RFLIFSIPTSLLMNKIGRKNTVLLSLVMTLAAMAVPMFTLNFTMLLLSFSLLGIGNAIMQTSLNPLVDSVMKGGASASTLTFGQFIKSIASFLAPIIASWGATTNAFGLGWQALYPIYLGVGVLATLLLFGTKITDPSKSPLKGETSCVGSSPLRGGWVGSFSLLSNPFVLLCFLAIICHVGIDVGTSITAPKILMERTGMSLNDAAFVCTIYFIAKAVGSFSGSFIMSYLKDWTFLLVSVLMMAAAACGLIYGQSVAVIYASVALMGYGNGNPFSIIFARAMQAVPEKKNEVSGLLIMGIFGGTVFPLLMGFASDAMGQVGAVLVMAVGILYLLGFWLKGKKA
ncbi:MAG: MFS transporter, partial [Bacteroidaceae bacterium]|nr:MFS transporter [Bacteroidaceae bacterium]